MTEVSYAPFDENISMSVEAHTSRSDYRAMLLFTGYPIAQEKYPLAVTVSFEHFREGRKAVSAVNFVYPRILRVRPQGFDFMQRKGASMRRYRLGVYSKLCPHLAIL